MDIITHAMMGIVAASPFAVARPEAAASFLLGTVLPDMDAFARFFGKRAFLRFHQTWSHSIAGIVAAGAGYACLLAFASIRAPLAASALMAGMVFHVILDWTNTYGVALLLPFSPRRRSLDWVFFIDAVVVAATAGALLAVGPALARAEAPSVVAPALWAAFLGAYWIGKAALRRRALALCPPGTVSLLPSALFPWRFLGCVLRPGEASLFQIDALTGAVTTEGTEAVLDAEWAPPLEAVPEFRLMRSLSPAYHVVTAVPCPGGVRLRCRDLRTRNFDTTFGGLDAVLGEDGRVKELTFHV